MPRPRKQQMWFATEEAARNFKAGVIWVNDSAIWAGEITPAPNGGFHLELEDQDVPREEEAATDELHRKLGVYEEN